MFTYFLLFCRKNSEFNACKCCEIFITEICNLNISNMSLDCLAFLILINKTSLVSNELDTSV